MRVNWEAARAICVGQDMEFLSDMRKARANAECVETKLSVPYTSGSCIESVLITKATAGEDREAVAEMFSRWPTWAIDVVREALVEVLDRRG